MCGSTRGPASHRRASAAVFSASLHEQLCLSSPAQPAQVVRCHTCARPCASCCAACRQRGGGSVGSFQLARPLCEAGGDQLDGALVIKWHRCRLLQKSANEHQNTMLMVSCRLRCSETTGTRRQKTFSRCRRCADDLTPTAAFGDGWLCEDRVQQLWLFRRGAQAEAVALRIPLRLLSALRRQQVQALAMDSSSDADGTSSETDAPPALSPAATSEDDTAQQSASDAADIAPEAAMAVLSGTSAADSAT